MRREQGHGLREAVRHRVHGLIEQEPRFSVAITRGITHILRRDCRRVAPRGAKHTPIVAPLGAQLFGIGAGGGSDRPPRRRMFQRHHAEISVVPIDHPEVADLHGAGTGSAIDLAVNDQAAANATSHSHIEDRREAPPRAEAGLGQSGGVGVVGNRDPFDTDRTTEPVCEREVLPAVDLVRFRRDTAIDIDGSAETDADSLDRPLDS